jgi:hypothetical protein
MKSARWTFAAATVVFFVLSIYDAIINHRRSLYDGPYIFLELGCAAATTIIAAEINDRKKQ